MSTIVNVLALLVIVHFLNIRLAQAACNNRIRTIRVGRHVGTIGSGTVTEAGVVRLRQKRCCGGNCCGNGDSKKHQPIVIVGGGGGGGATKGSTGGTSGVSIIGGGGRKGNVVMVGGGVSSSTGGGSSVQIIDLNKSSDEEDMPRIIQLRRSINRYRLATEERSIDTD